MANLTLSIDDHALAAARKAAAERSTTVNALVRDYLTRLSGGITPEQQEGTDWMLHYGRTSAHQISEPLPTREETYADRMNRLP